MEAVAAFDLSFERNVTALNGALSPNLKQVRTNAFARFKEMGIPTTKVESWKYTNLASLSRQKFNVASEAGNISAANVEKFLIPNLDQDVIVLVDGHFVPELSSVRATNGVTVHTIQKIASEKAQPLSDLVSTMGIGTDVENNAFTNLNTALFTDGVAITIAAGVEVRHAIHIVSLNSSKTDIMLSIRNVVVAGENSEAHIIESYGATGEADYFSAPVTEVICGKSARITHSKVQCESTAATHIGALYVRQAEKSHFTSNLFSFGGKVVRNEIHPEIAGEGCECLLNGLTVLDNEQHTDNTTVIDHAMPNCFSRELYKGIYGGKSQGAFSGTIIVRPDAQKTNAVQSNNSILLSDQAGIFTRPQLKIWADDVKCTHGATVGQLDDNALFYLRSRGIEKSEARNLLVHAFASDILTHVIDNDLREYLENMLSERLIEIAGGASC